MADKTNKFNIGDVIGLLAIVVIIISVLTLGMRMTGYATGTGIVNVTVNSQTSINFTTNFINFSSGYVNAGYANSTLDSNGTTSAPSGTWTWTASNFTIVNLGNGNVTLELKSGKTAATLLAGTSPAYRYAVLNQKANSCGTAGVTLGAWNTVNTVSNGDTICSNFSYLQTSNSVAIYVQLVVPSDAVTGNLTDTFTATATEH
jgi:hypothetical protein